MKKQTREARTTKIAKKPQIDKPVLDIALYGSDQDPCFGILYDPRTSECQRCGDSELCAIMLGQNNHLKRDKLETTQKFKDIEEKDIKDSTDPMVIKKSIKNRIREMAKMGGKGGVDINLIIDDVFASYFKDGFTKERIKKILVMAVEKSDKLSFNKNKTTLHYGTT